MSELTEILNFSNTLCTKAGKILMSGFRSEETTVSFKSRTDLVTNIDFESERFLVEKIKEAFPSHSITAEEGSSQEGSSEYIWYVDPLDATNNFAHGIPFFCISAGVFSSRLDRVVCGTVYDPYHGELFSASDGGGSTLNGKSIKVSDTADLGISMIATGFPYAKSDGEKNNLKEFNRILPHVQGIRRLGSAALDLCYLACGRIDGYWEPELKPWDTAAGSIIVQEAGGIVTKYNGEKFDPLYPQIAASNGLIHKSITGKLCARKQ